MEKSSKVRAVVQPGRIVTHDGKRQKDGAIIELDERQAVSLERAGHVVRVRGLPLPPTDESPETQDDSDANGDATESGKVEGEG